MQVSFLSPVLYHACFTGLLLSLLFCFLVMVTLLINMLASGPVIHNLNSFVKAQHHCVLAHAADDDFQVSPRVT